MDKAICLKKYEIESLLKSFLIFFSLQMILLGVIFVQSYRQGITALDDEVKNRMKICSFDLKCEGLKLDFVPASDTTKPRKLYKAGDLYSFFDVPTADGYMLKVILPKAAYQARVEVLRNELVREFLFYAMLIAVLSLLFSLYALRPLQKALRLNEEFVKDIIHDINTPLSSLMVNFRLFKKEIGESRKIERMEASVATILSLQNNLRAFLEASVLQKERFSVADVVSERVDTFRMLYPKKRFVVDVKVMYAETNRDAFVRIVDNLISNACKYSESKGEVKLSGADGMLKIGDDGEGIKDVQKVFDRYYKESQRGIGIGLHVVRKLCDATGIAIAIESERGRGTVVLLDLSAVTVQ